VNLTYFQPRKRRNVENKINCPLNIRFVTKTSDLRNFSQNIRSDVKTSEVVTLFPVLMMLTPLQLPFVCHNPSCDGCACDAEENRMRKKNLADKTQPRKDWAHSIVIPFDKVKNKKCKPPLVVSRIKWWRRGLQSNKYSAQLHIQLAARREFMISILTRPATVFWEEPKFFKLSPIVLHIFPGGGEKNFYRGFVPPGHGPDSY